MASNVGPRFARDASSGEPSRLDLAMRRFARGEGTAFAEVYALARPRLLRVLRRHGATDDEARDLLQDTFLRAHRARAQYHADRAAFPWLVAIARNIFIERRRGARARVKYERQFADVIRAAVTPADADSAAIARQAEARVLATLATLSGRIREPFILYRMEGEGLDVIADRIHATKNATKVRICRASGALRRALDRAW